MALLQIAEPGQATVPHQRRLAVGIDLGTTHSLVAAVRSGSAEVLANQEGERLIPSAVRYAEHGVLAVGRLALEAAAEDPHNTLVSLKRLMGRGHADALRLKLPYDIAEPNGTGSGVVRLRTAAGEVTPVAFSSEILKRLRTTAEERLGDSLVGAVITVPAYFDDAQRQATKDAAQLAGLHVLRLINEPTAAALAYGLESGAEGLYAVYDLGGGTFDISILRLRKGVFEVVATAGDPELGGDDFDERLALHWLDGWGIDRKGLSASEWRSLLRLARRVKEMLSTLSSDTERVSEAWPRESGNRPLAMISRAEFDGLTADLVDRTLAVCRQAMADAKLSLKEIQGVVLVGGSTRLRSVRRSVEALFGQKAKSDIHPDEVVAVGAALQANLLAGNRASGDDWLLLDVLPLSLGLETMGGLVERIIPRNTPIPVARAQEFTTYQDGQAAMALHVVQGERELVAECRSLARFELRGIPAMTAGAARIRVHFQVDADGLLQVSAQEKTTGVSSSIEVKPSYGLSETEIASMLEDAFSHAKDDMAARALREQQVETQQLLQALDAALEADGDLLSAEERFAVEQAIRACRNFCGGSDLRALREATERLTRLTDPFAERRMDRAVGMALAGQSIDKF